MKKKPTVEMLTKRLRESQRQSKELYATCKNEFKKSVEFRKICSELCHLLAENPGSALSLDKASWLRRMEALWK